MTKLTKTLLTVSLTSFALSLTGLFWGLFLPIAAVFLGLFMISLLLAKESALFDREQALRSSLVLQNQVAPARSKAPASGSHAPVFSAASFR
jgi:hypothetical protein